MIVASDFLEYLSIFNVPYGPKANPTSFTCYASSTANLTGYVYYNGPANDGIGATLTAPSNGAFAIDGTAPALDAKILYKNDTTGSGAYNGIYTLTTVGNGSTPAVLTRSTTYNTPAAINNGGMISIITGTVNGGTAWFNTSAVITIGVTPIVYQEFSPFQGILSPAQGGTGVNNGTNTLTLSGNTSFVGGHTFTGTLTANTNVTFPPAGTLVSQTQVQSLAFNSGVSSGSLDAYSVTLNPAPAMLTDGLIIAMTANHTNTGTTPTLTVNSLPSTNIVVWSGDVIPGDIENGFTYLFIYNGVSGDFELINPSISTANTMLVQSSVYNLAADTGTANAYVANLTPAPIVPNQAGIFVYLEVAHTNTGPSTLTLNGVTSPIVTNGNGALTGGEMLANGISLLFYSPTYSAYILINSALQVVIPKNGASRYVVDGGGNAEYTTIQSAITAAVANSPSAGTPGVIYIWAGTYNENLTLADYVYLVGVEYGAVTVNGTMTYAGTGAFYMQNIFANKTGGAATFIASSTGVPTLNNCNLMNTGGNCFQGSAVNSPSLINVTLDANAGAKHFALSAGCVVGWVNGLGNYTDTASTLSNAGLVIENCSLGGAFVLTSSTLVAANSSVSVFNENLSFCAMDNASVFRAQNTSIYSAAASANVVSGPGVFVADLVSLTGNNQTIDPFVQIQGSVNYLGYIARASSFVPYFISVVTGSTGGTTAINAELGSYYEFTGTTNQIATLPNAGLVYLAQGYTLDNQSSGVITVKDYGANTLFTIPAGSCVVVTCYNNVGSNGTWEWYWKVPGNAVFSPTLLETQSPITSASGDITALDGALTSYSGTASSGYLQLNATANGTGNFYTSITNASAIAQNQTCTIPDIGPSGTAQFIMSNTPLASGQTIGGFSLGINCVFYINNNTYISAGSNLNMYCPTAGAVTFAWQQMAVGNTLTITNDPAFAPTHVTYTIPYGGVTAANFLMNNWSGVQHISGGSLQVDAGNVTVAAGNNYIAYPAAANSGQLIWTATNNSSGNYNTTITNASAVAQSQTISIPDSGTSSASFILNNTSGAGQFINSGYLQVNAGNIYVGNGGGQHSLICYPSGANTGLLAVNATNNIAGNFSTTLTNASAVGQSQTISIPDCGSANSKFILSSAASGTQNIAGALTIGGNPIVDETDGTFTPQLQFGGANVGMAASVQGYYSRVGNTVTFAITITLSNKGSSTGSATVTGLPIAGRAAIINQNFYAAGNGLTFTSFPIGAIAGASTTLGLYDVISNTGGVPLDDTNFNNSTQLFVSGTYLA